MEIESTGALEQLQVAAFVCGLGPAMQTLDAIVGEVSRSSLPVLFLGESGTGKDTYARHIHRLSFEEVVPFRKINCTALEPDSMLAQFRDAVSSLMKAGGSGSIYLDNLHELGAACQRVLLAQLPDAKSTDGNRECNARFLSSSSKDLLPEVEAGRFRSELFFRLNGTCLHLPPLRERTEDIPSLLDYFLLKYREPEKREVPPLGPQFLEKLVAYRWPGNVRELENLARKLALLGDTKMVFSDFRRGDQLHASAMKVESSSLKIAARTASQQAERDLIRQALERTRWNRKQAARELQISYKSLLYKIKQIGPMNGEPGN